MAHKGTPKHKQRVFSQRVHVQKILGPTVWEQKNVCGKMFGNIVLVKMTSNIKELLKLLISVDLGTDLGHWGEFVRRKMMIGVCRTRLDGSRGPNIP